MLLVSFVFTHEIACILSRTQTSPLCVLQKPTFDQYMYVQLARKRLCVLERMFTNFSEITQS